MRSTSPVHATRMDLVCGPRIEVTARDLLGRWARDRVLSASAAGRLDALLAVALRHGLRFGPHGVSLELRWLAPDRVRLEVRWRGCADVAVSPAPVDLEWVAATLDELADTWGFEAGGGDPLQWMVVTLR